MCTDIGEEAAMGYRLQMSAEIHDWLADLRDSDPPAGLLVGRALTALAEEGGGLGPPLVISPADRPRPEELLGALDRRYQAWLESLQVMRRRVADVATLRKDIERQITELQSLRATLEEQRWRALDAGQAEAPAQTADELAAAHDLMAGLRPLLTGVIKAEDRLTAASQRQQAQVDAFRVRKEVLKAAYDAARAEYLIEEALDQDSEREDPALPVIGAAARLRDITGQMEREIGPQAPAGDLLDLRPGAPGDSDIRILFAVEPPGTALLIAVLEGRDAVRDNYREAVVLSAGVLRRVRAGQAPEAVAHAFADSRSFLGEFFPGRADEVSLGAAALVAANRPRPLAEQRTRLGLTQAQVARRMGVRQERVSAIERAEAGPTEVRTLAGYVEALGGRLDIIADFGGERVLLGVPRPAARTDDRAASSGQ
jgi:Helix-turn-helix